MNFKVLFITPHIGGGVGKAAVGAAVYNSGWESKIILLEHPEKPDIVERARTRGADIEILDMTSNENGVSAAGSIVDSCIRERLIAEIERADVVVINWWGHPLMTALLSDFPDVESRIVLWSHVNGCSYPHLRFSFLNMFDHVFFTSEYSYENKRFASEDLAYLRGKSTVIYGCGDFDPENITPKKPRHTLDEIYRKVPSDSVLRAESAIPSEDDFVVGCAGTLDFTKLSEDFVLYSERAMQENENLTVLLAGDMGEGLCKEIENSKYSDRFKAMGYVNDMEQFFEHIDVFGYLLRDDTYATTENVILEAMAHRIPVVCLDGGVERAIINNDENGILVSSADEYVSALKRLKDDTQYYERIAEDGRQRVCDKFSNSSNMRRMYAQFDKLIEQPKKKHSFKTEIGENAYDWFMYLAGKETEVLDAVQKNVFLNNPTYTAKTKGSPFHFLKYFPGDERLAKLCGR